MQHRASAVVSTGWRTRVAAARLDGVTASRAKPLARCAWLAPASAVSTNPHALQPRKSACSSSHPSANEVCLFTSGIVAWPPENGSSTQRQTKVSCTLTMHLRTKKERS